MTYVKKMVGGFILILLLASGVGAFNNFENTNEFKLSSREHLIVDPKGNGDYRSIQDAIDNASLGAVINVYAGVYYENIIINKTLTLLGNGFESTFINGLGSDTIVQTSSDWVNINGFTINGSGNRKNLICGIEIDNAQNCTINNNNCSNISYFQIYSNESVNFNGASDRPSDDRTWYSGSFIMGSTILIAIVIILISSILITSTEIGKYSLFSAMAPLYTKTRKKKKDHEYGYIKGSVRGYVLGNPGESYNNIKRELELPNGTLAYYLKVLEREEIIRSERDGTLRRFYPAKGKAEKDVVELNAIQMKIKNIVRINPGISQKGILSKLGISQQKLNYHI